MTLTALSAEQVRQEVLGTAAVIKRIAGADPAPWFRLPYGAENSSLTAEANGLGFVPIRWTVDTLGWQGVQARARTQHIRQRVLALHT